MNTSLNRATGGLCLLLCAVIQPAAADGEAASFGSQGVVKLNFPGTSSDAFYDARVMSDGSIVAAGWEQLANNYPNATSPFPHILVAKLSAAGAVTSQQSYAQSDLNGVSSLIVAPNGDLIVLGGLANSSGAVTGTAVRYTPGSTLSTVGKYSNGQLFLLQGIVDASGKVVIAAAGGVGSSGPVTGSAVRLSSTMAADTTFGTSGVQPAALPAAYNNGFVHSVTQDAAGNYVLTGVACSGNGCVFSSSTAQTEAVFAVRAKNSNGALDTSYGSGGVATAATFSGVSGVDMHAVTVDGAGRAVMVGQSHPLPACPSTCGGFIARLTAAGQPDDEFNGNGLLGGGTQEVESVLTDTQDRIYSLDYSGGSLKRQNTDGSKDRGFNQDASNIQTLNGNNSAWNTVRPVSGSSQLALLSGGVEGGNNCGGGCTPATTAILEQVVLMDTPPTQYTQQTVLHTFAGGSDGQFSRILLLQASDGLFYGGTLGPHSGAIFKIDSAGNYSVVYTFSTMNASGFNSDGAKLRADLIQGSDGKLYGATSQGGANGTGTLFALTTAGSFNLLHTFGALTSAGTNTDGATPYRGMVQASDGNFYGTAGTGGAQGGGLVFKLTPSGTYSVLYNFTALDASGHNSDGNGPSCNLVEGSDGDLYGCAISGGANGTGTIFKVSPVGAYTVLHTFAAISNTSTGANADGVGPDGALTIGNDGNFYGVAQSGGPNGNGTVFEMSPTGTLTLLHSFAANSSGPVETSGSLNADGSLPHRPLTKDGAGNLYGTTLYEGPHGSGVVFKITPAGTYQVLYAFSAEDSNSINTDGGTPWGGVTMGSDGKLYGAGFDGGSNGVGVIYKVDTSLTTQPAPKVFVSVYDPSIATGGQTSLSWASTNASACIASGAWSGSQATSGHTSVNPAATGSYTYTLNCSGGGGSGNASSTLTVTADPPAPTALSAAPGSGQVTLNWTAPANASSTPVEGYNVYQGTTAGGESATPVQTGVGGTSTVVPGLNNGTRYYYTVKAVAAGGYTTAASNEASATPVAPPAAPTGVAASPGNAQVTLSWTASPGATSYNVYQGTTAGGESTAPITTGIPGPSQVITGLSNGTKYYFKVAAVNSAGTSPLSTEASATPLAPPAAPTGVKATAGNAQVTLAWTATAKAASYNIYQGTTAGGESATPVKTGVTGTSVVITGLVNGTKYYFKVAGVDAGGVGAQSAEVSATPALTAPTAPTGITAAAGNARVTLSWTASAGNEASSYNVYRGTAAGGESATPVKTGVTGTSVVITGLTNGTTYYFKVAGVNSVGTSTLSAEAGATPIAPPAAPTGVTAAAGNAQVTLAWTASTNATSYNIYRGTAAGGEATTPVKTGVTGTSVVVTSLSNGTTYYFKVAGVDASGTSALSAEASAKPVAPALLVWDQGSWDQANWQ